MEYISYCCVENGFLDLRNFVCSLSFYFFLFFLNSGIKQSCWLIKLEPDEFKGITNSPIKPGYCCRLSLGRQLIFRSIIWEKLHGVTDMNTFVGSPDSCPFCSTGGHTELGSSRIFSAF